MDFPPLPFIKSSKKVKKYGGAVKRTASFSSDTPNGHKDTKPWKSTNINGVQDLPPPAQLLKKSSNPSGRKRSREISSIEQHLAQLKRKQLEINTTSDSSEILSVDMQLSENPSPQEVPSSPTLKRARNSFSNFSPPFYIAVEDNYTYRVSIDHEWEEAPVDVVVPKVTVKQVRKASLPFTEMTSKHQESFQFLQLRPEAEQAKMNPTHRCTDDPCSTNIMLNILPHEE